jgi:uncharacterized protein
MTPVVSAISGNLDSDILSAALPLFASGQVEALEWSFDAVYRHAELPEWFTDLLQAFSDEGRLVGHGVFFSLFSGRWMPEQSQWLADLERICKRFRFDHITEHFGFMTGRDFHQGAPLGVPCTSATLQLGIDRLKRLQNACLCPVGLENLAFAYDLDSVRQHGEFLHRLVEPVDGFIILDLHNLYCQLHNFEVDYADLISLYPLERVREIHISGGSWEATEAQPDRPVRRDTHDESVPTAVFDLLKTTLPRCPNLKFVVLEQLGVGLRTEPAREQFRQDFSTLRRIIRQENSRRTPAPMAAFLPPLPHVVPDTPLENEPLYQQQRALADILENTATWQEARNALDQSILAHSDWQVESWPAAMLETAVEIARKWK